MHGPTESVLTWFRKRVDWRFSLALLSGVLAGLAFPQPGWASLGWIAPGILLAAGAGASAGTAFRLGYLSGLTQFLISLAWLLYIPFPAGAISAWLALGFYCAVYSGLWLWLSACWLARFTKSMPQDHPASLAELSIVLAQIPWMQRAFLWLGIAAMWAGLEWLRCRFLTGFPWNVFGVTQWQNAPLVQIAAFTGVFGVSFILCWVSVAMFAAIPLIMARTSSRWGWMADLRLPVCALLVIVGLGFRRIMSAPAPGPVVRLALVQPSIPQTLIWDDAANPERFAKVLGLTRNALSVQPEILVWPEGSMPDLSEAQFREVTAELAQHQAWWVLGTGYGRWVDGHPEHYNAAILVDPTGRVIQRYHKRRLVIFGEFIPFEKQLPFMKWLTPIGSSFTPGREPVAFECQLEPKVNLSPVICFEDMFPSSTRDHVTPETDFLLELTNNGWFGAGSAHWQHCAGAALRAVENGVPVVRCANNGLTCWIDEYGRMRELLGRDRDVYAPGVLVTQVPRRPQGEPRPLTFYHEHGDVFGLSCFVFTCGVAGREWLNRRRTRKASLDCASRVDASQPASSNDGSRS